MNIINISTRKVGGIRFVKIGRLCLSFCVTKRYHALNAPKHPRHFTDIAPATFLSSADGVLVLGFHGETNV
jgi:hypothetical protein